MYQPEYLKTQRAPKRRKQSKANESSPKRLRWLTPARAPPSAHALNDELAQPCSAKTPPAPPPPTTLSPRSALDRQSLVLLSVEMFALSRPSESPKALAREVPEPVDDAIGAIAYCLQTDDESYCQSGLLINRLAARVIDGGQETVFDSANWIRQASRWLRQRSGDSTSALDMQVLANEVALLDAFVQLVRRNDVDFLFGYEIQLDSLGYLIHRATMRYGRDLMKEMSRAPPGFGECHCVGTKTCSRVISDVHGSRFLCIFLSQLIR